MLIAPYAHSIQKGCQAVVPASDSYASPSGSAEQSAAEKEPPKVNGTFDIDNFYIDVHFFFRLSSARREDYASFESVTGVVAEYAKRHVETRWVSMKKVTVRCLEQWANLKEYFLSYLPNQPNFKKDIEIIQGI